MAPIRRTAACPCGSGKRFKDCCGELSRYSAQELRFDGIDFEEIRRLVGRDDPVVLDVGSNDGNMAREFLRVFPRCRLIAFEPDPRAVARWRASIQDPRASLIETAIGAVEGRATFHQSSGQPEPGASADWDKSGSLRAPKTHLQTWPWCKFETTIEVPVSPLDRWTRELGLDRVDFLWADVQGAESDLIAGAAETLRMTRYFFTEYTNAEWFEGQIDLPAMRALLPDFEIVKLFSDDVLFRRRGVA